MLLKKRLVTPGPTATSERVRLALAAATPHHRSPEYSEMHLRLSENLKWLWDTDDDVLFVSGSGTATMESGMRTTLRTDDHIVVVTGGKFAERWLSIANLISDNVYAFDVPWGASADVDALNEFLGAMDRCDALICVASETSTGALHPVREIGATLRSGFPDALLLVDGITAVGTTELSMKRDEIDVLASGSQKAFGLPPGAGMVGVSARAWNAADRPGCSAYYMDLRRERKQTAKGQTAFTPAVGLAYALDAVLTDWRDIGRDELFRHADALADVVRAGVQGLGFGPFTTGTQSPALTTIKMPEGVSAKAISGDMRARLGTTVSAGQAEVADKMLRIGHIGAVDMFDMLQVISALEVALAANGVELPENGAGVAAAQKRLSERLLNADTKTYVP